MKERHRAGRRPRARSDGLTVAVNVTACPKIAGFPDEVMAVVVLAWAMVSVSGADVLAPELVSPPYWAVIACMPGVKVLVVNEPVPARSRTAVPSMVAPSKKVTMPLGVMASVTDTLTCAVTVTGCPATADSPRR